MADTEATEPRYCEATIFYATWDDPAEYCEEEAVEGSDYCEGHGAAAEGPDPDEEWVSRKEEAWRDYL